MVVHYYSGGYIVEYDNVSTNCESSLLLPAENLWSQGLRGFLYIAAMAYIFLGIAIVSDVFMCSIETITSKRRTIVRWDDEKKEKIEIEVLIWNETVANLTLMALGSSAPEILLAVIETCVNIGKPPSLGKGSLGIFTIIGSAAFNLLVITAICIVSVPTNTFKRIKEFGVFCLTSLWSIFAYVWMLIVVKFVTPNRVDMWEAWMTLAFFPIMVLMAYCQDNGWWRYKCQKKTAIDVERSEEGSEMNVRVVRSGSQAFIHGPSKQIHALEHEKHQQLRPGSHTGSTTHLVQSQRVGFGRARFRHAAVRSMMGGKKHHNLLTVPKTKMGEIVDDVRTAFSLDVHTPSEDLCGKFTFSSPSYSVMESAGVLEIDVLFYRSKPEKSDGTSSPKKRSLKIPVTDEDQLNSWWIPMNGNDSSKSTLQPLANGGTTAKGNSVSRGDAMLTSSQDNEKDTITGKVTVDFETREGTAKFDKDFKKTAGTLVFEETEYRQKIKIPIINDNQYELDTEFFIILKNPQGDAGVGEPSIARVLIIDDDEPGEFSFDKPSYTADLKKGRLVVKVVRDKGSDGTVSVEYSTIDGTARGGNDFDSDVDFISSTGKLTFKHAETSKTISFETSKTAKGSKNFIVTLKNPSLGCKLGEHSAALGFLSQDKLGEALADVLDRNEETMTWGEQIIAAMTVSEDEDDDGNPVPLHWYDYLLHFVMFFWKIFFALIPPRNILGAWPAFFISLGGIGLLVFFVEQLGNLLGCVINLNSAVTGITIVALGTSLPDTFASRTAALHDEYADAAIGNVTGSNSVNVFLGLGVPWVIACLYYQITTGVGSTIVNSDNVFQSTIVFSVTAVFCVVLLFLRRFVFGAELGGKGGVKWACGIVLVLLWVGYVTISSLISYKVLIWKLDF